MSSSGPGSVLVFLSFVILSSLLFGVYMTAYLGAIYAGEEVKREGEAATEQAIVYLYQHPTNISIVDGSPVTRGLTRIAIQNVGPREISFDRILAIGFNGDVVADVRVPGGKGLGARQWHIYRVQELGLPERWNNFTVFRSEVSRIILLSERGRTHGSIWGVPPFLEGVFRATLTTTATTTHRYTYIETSSFSTTYTVTIPPNQTGYSIAGEWWEGNSKVINPVGRLYPGWEYFYYCRYDACCWDYGQSRQLPSWQSVVSGMKANGGRIGPELSYYWSGYYPGDRVWGCGQAMPNPPVLMIRHFRRGELVTVVAEVTSYTVYKYISSYCCGSFIYFDFTDYYRLQGIELVDWETGEVYAATNRTSITFNIYTNTIVRFRYSLVESRMTSFRSDPSPSPSPEECSEILNTRQPPDPEWCRCAKIFLPEEHSRQCVKHESCLNVEVEPCCTGDEQTACLTSWSGSRVRQCVQYTPDEMARNATKTITVSWSASWTLKQGWAFDQLIRTDSHGEVSCGVTSGNTRSNPGDVSGSCTVTTRADRNYYVSIKVVFKRT